jgi:hypothetical protein
VRDGRLVGKKIGQYFFVTGENVLAFLNSGFSFVPRPSTRAKRTIEEDVERSRQREQKRLGKTKK